MVLPSQVEPKLHTGWWRCPPPHTHTFQRQAQWRSISCAQVISWDAVTSLSVEQSFHSFLQAHNSASQCARLIQQPPSVSLQCPALPTASSLLHRRHALLLPSSYLLLRRRHSRTRSRLPSVAKKCAVDESPRGPALLFNVRIQVSPLSRVSICKWACHVFVW